MKNAPKTAKIKTPHIESWSARHSMVLRLAELARRSHYYCEDSWHSCPKHPEGCANDGAGTECDCGADRINAEVDSILAQLSQNESNPATGDEKCK